MILPRQIRLRLAVVSALFGLPVLALSVCGLLYLRQHLAWYLYLPPLWGSMLAGYWLARRWTRAPVKPPTDAEPPPDHWTCLLYTSDAADE